MQDVSLPLLLPGMTMNTSEGDYYPIEEMKLMRFNGERWELFGDIISGQVTN
jgi:branched-chain amino acid transport system substrate-binding protein